MERNSLYNIMRSESERLKKMGIEMDISYYKEKNCLNYKNNEGMVSVYFDEFGEKGTENFYYRSIEDIKDDSKKELVLELRNNGGEGEYSPRVVSIPDDFKQIVEDYYFNREAINLEKPVTKKKENSYER